MFHVCVWHLPVSLPTSSLEYFSHGRAVHMTLLLPRGLFMGLPRNLRYQYITSDRMKKNIYCKKSQLCRIHFYLWFKYRESWAWYRPVFGVLHHPFCTHALQHRFIELCFISNRKKSLPIMNVCCWTNSGNLQWFYKVCIVDKMLTSVL